MIIHLPQPFSFFLPSALFPEGRDEDGKECDGFESAEEHGEADDEFAEIGECRVGTGGSELAEGRACVGHGGEGDSDGVHEGDSGADLLIQTNKYHKKSNRTLILIMQPLELR